MLYPQGLTRLFSTALMGAVLLASLPAQAAFGPSPAEIDRLYTEGDKKNADGDFRGAAESWTRLMVLLQEEGSNQVTRENLLLVVLDAHVNAYNRLPAPDGKKDISHLQEGKRTYELYLQQYRAVYGSGRAISSAVQKKSDELNAALEKAEAEAKAAATPIDGPAPPKTEDADKPAAPPIVLPPANNGTGLIVGGAITAALGFGALGLLIAGVINAPRAENDFEIAQSSAIRICSSFPDPCPNNTEEQQDAIGGLEQDIDDADKRGRVANALTITGAVLTPVLFGAGATMLAIGIKRSRKSPSARASLRLSPSMGRGFAGAVLVGRF